MESSKESSDKTSTNAQKNVLSQVQSLPNSSSIGNPITFEHPLLNPLIVDLIVEHLRPNFDQLKTLRLVSKVWTQATLNYWRKSGAVLTMVPDPPNFTRSKNKKGITVSKFLREFQDPLSPFQLSQKPFLKYKLKDFGLDFKVCSDSDDPSNVFWNEIGPLMESVHFYNCKFIKPVNDSSDSCPLARFLVELIPNLKDVALTNSTMKAEKDDTDATSEDNNLEKPDVVPRSHPNLRTLTVYGDSKMLMSLQGLFISAPGLEVISGVDLKTFTTAKQNLLNAIFGIKHHTAFIPPALSSLKHVDLINSGVLEDGNYDWNYINPNGIPPPPLETLTLHLKPDTQKFRAMGNLHILLPLFSRTLKTFKAFRAPVGPPYWNFLSNFSMISLEELHLFGTIAPNFAFLGGTPNLKKLVIDLGCFEKREMTKDLVSKHFREYKHQMCRKYENNMVAQVPRRLRNGILCSELEYLEVDYEFPWKSLDMLGKWMPNLKTLKTILNWSTFQGVCEIWGDLTELVCLHGSKVDDRCFIRDEGNSGGYSKIISYLKGLERFQLDAYCDDCELTDDVVYNGFLKMPALKSVEICVNSQMSARAEDALRKGIPFSKVVRVDHEKCGGSSGKVFAHRCNRCEFRRETVSYLCEESSDEGDSSGSDDSRINFWGRRRHWHCLVSDEDEFGGSGDGNISG